jgi:adenylate cyclase
VIRNDFGYHCKLRIVERTASEFINMKKIILLFILLFSCQHALYSQDQRLIDSLQTILKDAKQDSTKADILNALSIAYWSNDPDRAMDYAKQELALSEQAGYQKGIGNGYNAIAFAYYWKGNYPSALEFHQKALKIFEGIGEKQGLGEAYNGVASLYSDYGNYSEALKNYLVSLKIRQEIGDKKGMAGSYNNIGEIYRLQRNFPKALESYLAALKINEETGNTNWKAINHYNIGLIYEEQENYPEALKNYFTSLEEMEDKDGIASINISIGNIYTKQNKFNEAALHLDKGLTIANEIGSLYLKRDVHNAMATLNGAQGKHKEAMENYKRYINARDSMFSQENNKKMVQHQMQYEFDKKETLTKAENEKVLQKQTLLRNGFIGGTILFLLLAVAIFIGLQKTGKAKKKSEQLLLNILPAEVAEEIKTTGTAKAKAFTMVTVMFTDFKDFTTVSEKVSAELLVDEIHTCFSAFDHILQKHKIEKIKTIGDAYLCASGLPVSNYTHAVDMLNAAFEIRDYMIQRKKEKETRGEIPFELRIGIHTGPVVAGIVGVKKYAYDIWGDTVNLAARMEQNSEAGKINISGSTYELVKEKFNCIHRGKIEAKNKGVVDMYFVE